MKRILTTSTLCLFTLLVFCQDQSEINLDILRSPTIPSSTLIGQTNSEINKPSDPNEILFSIQNGTNNFSQIPSNYSIEIAPAWIFRGESITYEEFAKNKLTNNLWQNFTFSISMNSNEKTDSIQANTKLGMAFKFSFLRGNINKKSKKYLDNSNKQLRTIAAVTSSARIEFIRSDPDVNKLQKDKALANTEQEKNAIQNKIDKLINNFEEKLTKENMKSKAYKTTLDSIQNISDNIQFGRTGFKLDLVGGLSYDFPDNVYSDNNVYKAGIWLTGGYEGEKGLSALGILRYLYNPDKILADDDGVIQTDDVETIDYGLKILYHPQKSNFSSSIEFIRRGVIDSELINSSWKYILNAEYKIQKNTSLNLSFGRGFEGDITKDGNVIALLSVFKGFGNNRNLE